MKIFEKVGKIRDSELRYDFLPAMQEITERPPNKLGNVILCIVLLLIVTTIIWASNMMLDITVSATGAVLPQGGLKAITTGESGRVIRVYAEEGDYVKEGEVIAAFDDAEIVLKLKENDYELSLLNYQRNLYASAYDQIQSNGIERPLSFDTAPDSTRLLIEEAVIREHTEFLYELAEVDSIILLSDETSVRTEAQRAALIEERILSVVKNLNSLDAKIESANLEKEGLMQSKANCQICAPVSGTLTQVSRLYESNYLTAGTVAGYVLPENEEMIFNAYIADEDVSAIDVSDHVSVRIAAFGDTDYSLLQGEVLTIGKASLSVENLGTVYMVELRLEEMPDNVRAGMEGSCDIIIGKRSVLEYFLDPFKKGLESSMKEK